MIERIGVLKMLHHSPRARRA